MKGKKLKWLASLIFILTGIIAVSMIVKAAWKNPTATPPGNNAVIKISPDHQWSSTNLRFQNPDGTWGPSVDLMGARGVAGTNGTNGSFSYCYRKSRNIGDWGADCCGRNEVLVSVGCNAYANPWRFQFVGAEGDGDVSWRGDSCGMCGGHGGNKQVSMICCGF